mmetsp:Transcript_5596/g.7386  ORF Transcript_5596/g.7386 Transcript_5596/m.7386 type:complete len:304 (-) Transcript_5596:54-965(-)
MKQPGSAQQKRTLSSPGINAKKRVCCKEMKHSTQQNAGDKTWVSQCNGIRSSSEPLLIKDMGKTFHCIESWATQENLLLKAEEMKIKYFVSTQGRFYLDGTWHPQALLTNLNSKEGTLREFMKDSKWPSRYLVESMDSTNNLSNDVPSQPWFFDAFDKPACLRQLFVSIGPTVTQVHRDWYHNIYLCVSGQREWRLANPCFSSKLEREPGSVSARDPPYDDSVEFCTFLLHPGEGLFIPAGWWHCVESPCEYSAAVNWYFDDSDNGSKIQRGKKINIIGGNENFNPSVIDDDNSNRKSHIQKI